MRRTVFLRALVALAILALAPVSMIVATERSAATMTAAATAFVDALSTEQRQHAVFPYADAERLRWHFIPNEMFPRKGVSFRTMTPAQKDKAHALLKSGLSQKGYLTATAIIDLEDTLRAIENSPRFARSPLDYQFTVFGTPGSRGTWGWRVEGHHLSLHFAVANGRVAATSPTFTGSNPADRQGRSEEGPAGAGAARGRRPRRGRRPDGGAAGDGDRDRGGPDRHRVGQQERHRPAGPGRPRRRPDDAGAARRRDAPGVGLHVDDGRRPGGGADGPSDGRRARPHHLRVGRARRRSAPSTTTASRARRSSSSTTTRRTTAITSTPCGATSRATSGATCCASTCARTTPASSVPRPRAERARQRLRKGPPMNGRLPLALLTAATMTACAAPPSTQESAPAPAPTLRRAGSRTSSTWPTTTCADVKPAVRSIARRPTTSPTSSRRPASSRPASPASCSR